MKESLHGRFARRMRFYQRGYRRGLFLIGRMAEGAEDAECVAMAADEAFFFNQGVRDAKEWEDKDGN